MITKPTRIIETTATLHDHIYTNDINPLNSGVLISQESDHLPVYLFSTTLSRSPKVNLLTENTLVLMKRSLERKDFYDNLYTTTMNK